jgi:hypothetical protein
LQHVLRIDGASSDSESGAKDLVVMLAKEGFQLFRRIGDRSEVFYCLHVVLLEFIVHE